MRITIDSSAWVEVIRGSSLGSKSAALVLSAEACHTPSIVVAEVARWCLGHGLDSEQTRRELAAIEEASTVTEIDPQLAIEAARATRELRQRAATRRAALPGLADGLVLATARRTQSLIVTRDSHFAGLPEAHLLGTK